VSSFPVGPGKSHIWLGLLERNTPIQSFAEKQGDSFEQERQRSEIHCSKDLE
jgi:hypothetical protein